MSLAILEIDILGDVSQCELDCPEFITKWCDWCMQYDKKRLALIKVSDNYFFELDAKSRNMIRKVHKRGYLFHGFNYNDYLQDIYEINTSKEIRQDKFMSSSYLVYPTAVHTEFKGCTTHKYLRLGCFKDGVMFAYCAVAVLNELAIVNTIIGHAQALTDGVMNGLIDYLVAVCNILDRVKYINYLTMESSSEGLQMFKRSVGFESYQVTFK